jgi:Fe-S-cluster-containing hydrogenase component 2
MADKNTSVCKPEAGKLIPVVNLSKCEGKKDCVEVCPYDVFEMQAISMRCIKH